MKRLRHGLEMLIAFLLILCLSACDFEKTAPISDDSDTMMRDNSVDFEEIEDVRIQELIEAEFQKKGYADAKGLASTYYYSYLRGLMTSKDTGGNDIETIRIADFPEDLESRSSSVNYAVMLICKDGTQYTVAITDPGTLTGEEALYKNGEQVYQRWLIR